MIISEKQVMQLIIFTNQLAKMLFVQKEVKLIEAASEIDLFLTEIAKQQSSELREVK